MLHFLYEGFKLAACRTVCYEVGDSRVAAMVGRARKVRRSDRSTEENVSRQ